MTWSPVRVEWDQKAAIKKLVDHFKKTTLQAWMKEFQPLYYKECRSVYDGLSMVEAFEIFKNERIADIEKKTAAALLQPAVEVFAPKVVEKPVKPKADPGQFSLF